MKKPSIELSECILCGVCESVYPDAFRLTEAGYMEVVELSEYSAGEVDEAIKNCPAGCIAWEEEG